MNSDGVPLWLHIVVFVAALAFFQELSRRGLIWQNGWGGGIFGRKRVAGARGRAYRMGLSCARWCYRLLRADRTKQPRRRPS